MTQATPMHLPAFAEAMVPLYTQRSALDAMLLMKLGQSLDQINGENLPLDLSLYFKIGLWALSNGRFAELVAAVWDDRRQPPGLKALHDEFFAPSSPAAPAATAGSPCDDWLLGGGEVFFDRAPLRRALRNIEQNRRPRVIAVRGEPMSGKSYSHRLVQHVADAHRHKVVWVDLLSPFGEPVVPVALANTLLMSANLSTAGMPGSGDPSVDKIVPLVAFVVGKMRTLEGTWWFVLDRCVRAKLPPAVWSMVFQLALSVGNNLDGVNLVLLDVDEDPRTLLKSAVADEKITPIGVEQVETFLTAQLAGASPPFAPERIRTEARKTVEGLEGTEDDPALAQLGRRALEALQRLRAEGSAGP